MKSTRLLVLLLLPALIVALLADPAFTQKKKKPSVPAVFNNAQYVWVESMDGDIYTPGLLPADRQAIIDVQNALQDWGRYTLTAKRSEAELIFVVRTGRIAEGRVGVTKSGPMSGPAPGPDPGGNPGQQQHPMGTGVMLGEEAGPPDDLLEVRQPISDSKRSTTVWLRSQDGGLASPDVPLFKQLKAAVEHDYPR